MDFGLILGSLLAAFVGGLTSGFWNRRAAKKVPKTERRASAYEEVVVRLVSESLAPGARTPLLVDDPPFHDAVARVFLFGESKVVSALSSFLEHRSTDSHETVGAFLVVLREMRKSLMTGHDDRLIQDIRTAIAVRVPPGTPRD